MIVKNGAKCKVVQLKYVQASGIFDAYDERRYISRTGRVGHEGVITQCSWTRREHFEGGGISTAIVKHSDGISAVYAAEELEEV